MTYSALNQNGTIYQQSAVLSLCPSVFGNATLHVDRSSYTIAGAKGTGDD